MITETSSRIVKILSNHDLKIQSFPREDKKSGKRYTIRETVNALYSYIIALRKVIFFHAKSHNQNLQIS